MDHLVVVGFLVYAALFRLAIIATGVAAIVLGYKLFLRGVMGEGGTTVNAEAGQIKLTLDNAGPGGVFALFGAGIIIVMLSQGSPELLMKKVKEFNATATPQSTTGTEGQITEEIQVKSGNHNESSEALKKFEQAYHEGVQKQRSGDIDGAVRSYNKSLSYAASVLNDLAWTGREQHRIDEAIVLARIATTVDQNNANAFDTLALILLDRKELQAAEQAAQAAVDLDPANKDHQKTLQTVRAAKEAAQAGLL